MKKSISFKIVFLALLLTALTFGVVSAGSSVVLNGYTIEFLGVEMNGSTGTFTYAVTTDLANSDLRQGLSHWTIGIGNCTAIDIGSPATSGGYLTPVDAPSCGNGTYSCQAANYSEVEHGLDPTTGVSGVKFGDVTNLQLSKENPGTHIFRITLDNVVGTQDVLAGVKTSGNTGPSGLITGPLCDNPTAVSLNSVSTVSTGAANPISLFLAAFLFVATALIVWARQRKAIRT